MSLRRPPIYFPFLPKRSLHTPGPTRTNPNTTHSDPPKIDPHLRALLYDVDLSLARPTAKARKLRRQLPGYQSQVDHHRELEVVQDLPDSQLESLAAEEEDADQLGPFPLKERKSPAASFGSRQIGAVVLPWELQKSVTRLLNESEKHLVHTDAKRLFRHSSATDSTADRLGFTPRSWEMHYVPPAYTEVNSISKMSHISARKHKQRDGTAFASVVMPAQYAVIRAVLEHVKTRLGPRWAENVERVVEWGSGTGAGLWAAMHTFRRPEAEAQVKADPTETGTGTEITPTESLIESSPSQEEIVASIAVQGTPAPPETTSISEEQEQEEEDDIFDTQLLPPPITHINSASDITLSSTHLTSYIAIEKRDGLSAIARRLLRDVPLPSHTHVSLHKYFHDSERVQRTSELGLGTVALSAFLLNTFGSTASAGARAEGGGSAVKRKEVLNEMWESGADVLVVIEDATMAGFQNVVDAREYFIKLGKKEVKRRRAANLAAQAEAQAQGDKYEGKTLGEMGIDDLHPELADWVVVESNVGDVDIDGEGEGKWGAHVVAPCPHDKPCPLAFHQRLSSSGKRSAALQISAKTVRCTFVQRLQRPEFVRLTKHAKKGEEDVGYSYVVVRRGEKVRKGVVGGSENGRVGAVGRWEEEKLRERERAEERAEEWRESAESAVLVGQQEPEQEQVQEQQVEEGEAVDVDVKALDQEDVPSAMVVENVDLLKREALEDLLREEAYDWPRVNFPPLKRSGHVIVDACMPEGSIMRMTFTRSQSKQIYHDARKSKWGDIFPHSSKNKPVLRYMAPNIRGPKQPSPGVRPQADPEEEKEERKAQKQLDELFGMEEEKVGKKRDKAMRALQSKKLLSGRRGGEGALSKEEKVSTRAGWDEIVGELKKGDKERRKIRKEARLLKEKEWGSSGDMAEEEDL